MGHKLRSDPAETMSRSREQAVATRATIVMVLAILIAPKTGTGDGKFT